MSNPYFGADGPLPQSDAEWQQVLTPEQFRIARQHGTERAFTGAYNDDKEPGVYRCVCCGQPLFTSDEKYDSGSGWPSFWKPKDQDSVGMSEDNDFFTRRVEVHCSRCRAHLGHVFDDGPKPTGLRYCVNSACLVHDPQEPARQDDQ